MLQHRNEVNTERKRETLHATMEPHFKRNSKMKMSLTLAQALFTGGCISMLLVSDKRGTSKRQAKRPNEKQRV